MQMIRAILENIEPLAIGACYVFFLLFIGTVAALPPILEFFGLPVP